MSEALEALETLRENIRSEDGQIWRQGIRDNDETRAALTVLMNFASAALEQGEAVAYIDPQALENFKTGCRKEFAWAQPDSGLIPFYTAPPSTAEAQPRMTVRLLSFPDSNGRRNWTAMIARADKWGGLIGNCGGITIARSELWNRVAYEAECAKLLIGERTTQPDILDYGDDIETPEEWKGEVRGGHKVEQAYTAPPSTAEAQAMALEHIFTKLLEAIDLYEPGTPDYAGCCVADTLLLTLFPEYRAVQKQVREAKRIREEAK